ncbi:MAG: hypothetical protein AAFP08_00525 [Bacteroidota bacterium]
MLEPENDIKYVLPKDRSGRWHADFIAFEAVVISLIFVYIMLLENTSLLDDYDGDEYGIAVGVLSAVIGGHHLILGSIQAWRSNLGGIRRYIACVMLYLMYPVSLYFFKDFYRKLIVDGNVFALTLMLPLPILAWWMSSIQYARLKWKEGSPFMDDEEILDA